jgi:tetratricopeptide (TPR) repeat protein
MILPARSFVVMTLCLLTSFWGAESQQSKVVINADQLAKYKLMKMQLAVKADGGDSDAPYELGLIYEFPLDGKAPDRVGAAYWYKQAADRGVSRGAYRLGVYYYDRGEDDLAFKYFEQAANKGMPAAMYRYGDMIIRTNFHGNGKYYGLPWLQKAAAVGDPDAQNELGRRAWQLYLHPGPVGSEHTPAEWFARAAASGSCEGALNLGGVYFNGVDVRQDAAKADQAFKFAESCPGAPSWVLQKAQQYRKLIEEGRLPDPSLSKPEPPSSPPRVDSKENQIFKVFAGVVAAIGVAAILGSHNTSSSSDASSSNDYMDDFWEAQRKRQADFALGNAYCSDGQKYAAGMLGVWCP